MRLCSHHLRIGILVDKTLVRVKNGFISGPLGKLYTQFLFSENQGNLNNCTIRFISTAQDRSIKGASQSSGSYLLRTNQLDLAITKKNLGHGDDLIEETRVIGYTRYEAAQYLKPQTEQLDLSNFLVENVKLFAFFVVAYLLIALAVALLPRLVHENCSSRLKSLKLLCKALFIDHSQLPSVHLKMIFFCFTLFLFFNLQFLCGAIRTDQVVVPTNEIVDSPAELVDTRKTLVITKIEQDLIMNAPHGSFLKRLQRKFFLIVDRMSVYEIIRGKGINRFVVFTERVAVFFYLDLLSDHARRIGSVAIAKPMDYYERLGAFQMRRWLDEEKKQFINRRLEASLEFGFTTALFSKLRELLMFRSRGNVKVYETIDDYVEEVTQKYSPNVKLENVRNLFIYFVAVLILILFLFIIDVFLLKPLRKIKRRQVRRTKRFLRRLSMAWSYFRSTEVDQEN